MTILMVESHYHANITDMLVDGATAALDKGGAEFERVSVPGALEIPAAIALAARAQRFDGFIALGTVIQSGTMHFEIITRESAHGLMRLSADHALCIGNGIIAAVSEDEAQRMADHTMGDAGGDAARACLALVAWRQRLGLMRAPQ